MTTFLTTRLLSSFSHGSIVYENSSHYQNKFKTQGISLRFALEGIVDKILERGNTEVVGTFQKNKRFGFVVSDDKRNNDDVFLKKSDFR